MALVAVAFFVTLALFVALVFVVVTALIVVIAFAECCEPFVVYPPHPSPRRRRRTTPHLPHHGLASAASSPLRRCDISSNQYSPYSSLEALAEESIQKKENIEKNYPLKEYFVP